MLASARAKLSEPPSRRPLVSIAMPVHDAARDLAQTLDTLLAQTVDDFELIVCDDASRDDTEAIARRYAARDPRVRYVRSAETRGAAYNHNLAFMLARGPYFRWSACGEQLAPDALRRYLEALDASPEAVLAWAPSGASDSVAPEVAPPAHAHRSSPSPARRLREVISGRPRCDALFGVIRSEPLRETGLIGAFPNAIRVLLGELALQGDFVEVDGVGFRRPESTVARCRAGFADTWRLCTAHVASVRRARLRSGDRARCLFAALATLARRPRC